MLQLWRILQLQVAEQHLLVIQRTMPRMSIELASTIEEEGEGNYAEVAAGKWALGKWDCCITPWKLLDRSLELSAVISQGASVIFCWRLWLTTSYFSDYGCIYFSVHLLYTMRIKLLLPTNEAVGEAVLWRISLCKFLSTLSNCRTFCQKDRVGVQGYFCPFTLKLQILSFCQFDTKFFTLVWATQYPLCTYSLSCTVPEMGFTAKGYRAH
jgi:hypothetical protein